ncbi:MAG: sulfotransferase [Bacteroidales bacterium]|nr:sulfotransferase [Bacteroidales bacterium]
MEYIMLYGLQRTGTNYLETLLPNNFKNIELLNDGSARSLPVHKHFRLYDEQFCVPEPKYYNNFKYESFSELQNHVTQLTGVKEVNYIVAVRNPYNWYLSYRRLARKNVSLFNKNKWFNYVRRDENPHFMIDFNLFYKKWLAFQEQDPGRIMLVRHEDMLNDVEQVLNTISDKFHLEKKSDRYLDSDKVNMSKKFTAKKRSYYLENKFLKEFGKKELEILTAHLEKEVITKLGYELQQ